MKNLCLTILTLFTALAFAQEREITGTVTSVDGEPLPGATILIEGTITGTASDFEGEFTLMAESGDVLVVSYVGFTESKVTIGADSNYQVVLSEDANLLDAVILTGYATEKKSDIAGAISVVEVEDLTNEFSPNVLTAIQGRVAGVQVNSGGSPGGSDSQIVIRGLTTVGAGSSPLWVIDGVQTFNPGAINPDEVESMQVLKDGASTALYGTSAANGVIVVTTKSGKVGSSDFQVKVETTVNWMRDQIATLNAEQWTDVYYQARSNDGISGDFGPLVDDGTGFVIPEYLDDTEIIRSSDTDWVDEIVDPSFSTNLDANYRYGNEKFQVYTQATYVKDNGIQNYTYFERFNARLNASVKLWNDRVTIGENFLYSNINEVKANEFENAILQNPLHPVYTEIDTYMAPVIQDKPNSVANLWANRKNRERSNRFLGNVYANINIIEGLDFSTKLNFDYTEFRFDTRTQPFVQMFEIPSVFQNIDADSIENESLRTIWTNLLTYEILFGENHRINALLGLEYTKQDDDFLTDRIRGVDITEYPLYIIRDDAEFQTITNKIEYRKQSQFASLKYVYDDRYVFTGTIRRDGSSRFGANNKYGVFPSLSFAWNAINESFLESSDVISNLKLRASWGINGNDLIGDYLYLNSYADNTTGNIIEFADYDIDGDGVGTLDGILQVRQANPDIKWEETSQINFGFDLGFLDNRLTMAGDIYDKRTDNLILTPIAQAINGEANPPTINAGEVSNKGFEFIVGYQDNRSQDFSWGATFNFTRYVNNVESLDTDNNFLLNNSISITRAGDPIASFYGLIADGIFRTPEEVAVHAQQPGKDLGRIRYRDLNSDGVVNNDDRTIIGNPHPDFIYGLNLNATYKAFTMSLYFDGKQGHDIYNTQRNLGDFTYFSFNFHRNTLDAWTPENANSNVPALSTTNSNNETQPSSYFVEDGSYFRLKNLYFGYTIPQRSIEGAGLNDLTVYLIGQNLFDVTSFTGFDYEVSGLSAAGIGIATYGIPHTRSFTLGLSVKF